MSNHPLTPQSAPDLQKKAVLNLYAAFAVSLILTLVPHMIVGLIALIFALGVLIAAYVMRFQSEKESLIYNHTTYIIRTIWIGSSLSVVTVGLASAFMLGQIDYAPFSSCGETMAAQGMEWAANATYAQVWEFSSPCFNSFITANLKLLIISGAIAILPILLYFIIRFGRGLSRALHGYRLAKPKAWF